jgi:hypothetical protein
MSNSPYLPPNVKEYMKQYKIEEVVGDAVNAVIKNKSDDPYALLSVYFNNVNLPMFNLVSCCFDYHRKNKSLLSFKQRRPFNTSSTFE